MKIDENWGNLGIICYIEEYWGNLMKFNEIVWILRDIFWWILKKIVDSGILLSFWGILSEYWGKFKKLMNFVEENLGIWRNIEEYWRILMNIEEDLGKNMKI